MTTTETDRAAAEAPAAETPVEEAPAEVSPKRRSSSFVGFEAPCRRLSDNILRASSGSALGRFETEAEIEEEAAPEAGPEAAAKPSLFAGGVASKPSLFAPSERAAEPEAAPKAPEPKPVNPAPAPAPVVSHPSAKPKAAPAAEPEGAAAPTLPAWKQELLKRKNSGSLAAGTSAKLGSDASAQMQKAQQSRAAADARGKGLGTVDAKSLAMGGAGQGGGLGLNRPGFGPKVTHFSGARGSTTAVIKVDEEIPTAWSQVMDDNNPLGWILCEYDGTGKGLVLSKSGPGGLTPFKECLGENLAWGGFRCNAVDKRGGVECKRPKFIFVMFKPECVSMIKRARQASHKGDVKEAISGTHIDVVVENIDEFTEELLIENLQRATGAHKPNGYEFDDGKFCEADFYGLGIGKDCKGESSSKR